ncbi:MAG: PASTA domain-containing protein [Ignavibacteria bacterium]|nr:PASTA domain-containing protein [Ignavibacteria bacterium]
MILAVAFDKLLMPWYVGEPEARVNNVVGMTYEQAEEVLTNAKFQPVNGGIRYDQKYPAGTVILQKPEPNTTVKQGRRVYLIVSGGEQMLEMPNLRLKSLRDANIALSRLGIILGTVTEDTSNYVPRGAIMEQSIPNGSKVGRGTVVNITLSSGKPLGDIDVPDVVGKSLSEARRIIESSGLKVGKISYQVSIDLLPNTVVLQFPRSGEKIKEQSVVDIFVVREKVSEQTIRDF